MIGKRCQPVRGCNLSGPAGIVPCVGHPFDVICVYRYSYLFRGVRCRVTLSTFAADKNKPGVSASSPQVPVPASAVPNFHTPERVVTDGFWSNLKQFLTEKPIKISGERSFSVDAGRVRRADSATISKTFSSPARSEGPAEQPPGGQLGREFWRLRLSHQGIFLRRPSSLPLPPGIQPVKVKDIWSKDENFGWTQLIAIGLHVVVIALRDPRCHSCSGSCSTDAKNKLDMTPLDISPYMTKLPAGAQESRRRRWRCERSHADSAEQGQAAQV